MRNLPFIKSTLSWSICHFNLKRDLQELVDGQFRNNYWATYYCKSTWGNIEKVLRHGFSPQEAYCPSEEIRFTHGKYFKTRQYMVNLLNCTIRIKAEAVYPSKDHLLWAKQWQIPGIVRWLHTKVSLAGLTLRGGIGTCADDSERVEMKCSIFV